MTGPGGNYDPKDFGADGISSQENWRDSGYTHHTAWSRDGSRISWNDMPEDDVYGVDAHLWPGEADSGGGFNYGGG